MAAEAAPELGDLMVRIESVINREPDHPWCVHRLFETVLPAAPREDRWLELTENAADTLAREGRVHREPVSAMTIGLHCQDCLYWSSASPAACLADFGPDYESPKILRRLTSHFECRGL